MAVWCCPSGLSPRKSAPCSAPRRCSKLETGQTIEGVVRRIADFGAFVDIGGVDGLLHISDMAWENVATPDDIVKVGDMLQVLVLRIERDGERISLGLKQLQEDPWNDIRRAIREDDLVEVTIERVEQAGAVGKSAVGCGMASSPAAKSTRAAAAMKRNHAGSPDKRSPAKVLEVRNRERNVILSVRQAARERERSGSARLYEKTTTPADGPPTLGDLFSDVFSKLKKND